MTEQLVLNRIADAVEKIANGGISPSPTPTPTPTPSASYVSILTVHEVVTESPDSSDDNNQGDDNNPVNP